MNPNFRNAARAALTKAKARMSAGSEDDIRYAALQLRMSLEALTYERAMAYAEDLGPDRMKTWQPRQLMNRMLEVDPVADRAVTLSVGKEPSLGERPESMRLLGTDNVLKLDTLKENYDALGSYLHTPTLRQIERGRVPDMARLMVRCETIIEAVELVLSSEVWGTSIAKRGTIECEGCRLPLTRRIPTGLESREVQCWECDASYTMRLVSEGRVAFDPHRVGVACVSPACEASMELWEREIQCGIQWDCQACGTKQRLDLFVTAEIEENQSKTSGRR